MLRISKKADYAVFLLGAIAREGAFPGGEAPDRVVSAQEIASQAGLNKSVVANLLKEFARDGLLESVRGLRGGYRLTLAPAQITLGRILEVVEGPFVLVDCVGHEVSAPDAQEDEGTTADGIGADCALISFCPSKRPMRVVHERIQQMFAEIHLDELCALATGCASGGAAPQPEHLQPEHLPNPTR